MNKVMLLGRLTKDPEQKFVNNRELEISNFTLAVNKRLKKQDDKNTADFISITTFNKLAAFCNQHFKKGRQVAIVGRIDVSSWDKDGVKQWKTVVIADEAYFADSKPVGENVNSQHSDNNTIANNNGFSIDDNTDDMPF